MVDKDAYYAAYKQVHWKMYHVLRDWMEREKINLDGFINHPEGHAEYSPYMTYDFDKLRQRSASLDQIAQGLLAIEGYLFGYDTATESMAEYALDSIPAVIFQRLYDWMVDRYSVMEKTYAEYQVDPRLPLKDYVGLATFDAAKYLDEMTMYKTSIDNLGVVLEFKKQG